MSPLAAHPIRCWFVFVVTQRRVDCFISAIKVCKLLWRECVFLPDSLQIFCVWLPPCLLLLSVKRTDCSSACLHPSFLMRRSSWQAKNLKLVGGNGCHKETHPYTHEHTQSLLSRHSWPFCIRRLCHPDFWNWSIYSSRVEHSLTLILTTHPIRWQTWMQTHIGIPLPRDLFMRHYKWMIMTNTMESWRDLRQVFSPAEQNAGYFSLSLYLHNF